MRNMTKLKQLVGGFGKKAKWAGSIFAIMFLLPTIALADVVGYQDAGTTDQYRIISVVAGDQVFVDFYTSLDGQCNASVSDSWTGIVRIGRSSTMSTTSSLTAYANGDSDSANGCGTANGAYFLATDPETLTIMGDTNFGNRQTLVVQHITAFSGGGGGGGSATTTIEGTVSISNGNQDFFNVLLVFWIAFLFIIWFFKVERKTRQS